MMDVGSHGEGGGEYRLEEMKKGNKEKYDVTNIGSIDLKR